MKVTGQGCGKQPDARVQVESQFAGLACGYDLDQFIGEVAVGLKEGSGTDAVVRSLRLDKSMTVRQR